MHSSLDLRPLSLIPALSHHRPPPSGAAGLAQLSPDLIRSIDLEAATTSRPLDKVDILRSTSGGDGDEGIAAATLRLRLAVLLLLPPDFRAHSRRLRDRTRTPSSRSSHWTTVEVGEAFGEWVEMQPERGRAGYRSAGATRGTSGVQVRGDERGTGQRGKPSGNERVKGQRGECSESTTSLYPTHDQHVADDDRLSTAVAGPWPYAAARAQGSPRSAPR